jgi:two-component system cell cycle sensor histidine kinase/response regulator CckA
MSAPQTRPSRVLSARQSLGWRLPLTLSGLIAAVLAVFLWAAYREVAATLVRAGGDRAQGAAGQLATLLERSAQQAIDELRRTAAHPDLQRHLQNPTTETDAAVRARLSTRVGSGSRRVELWNTAGARVLEVVQPAAAGQPQRTVPAAGEPPTKSGLSEFRAEDDLIVSDAVTEIMAPPPASARLGYLVVRSTISVNPPGILSRLVGADATILIGNRSGGAWTDLTRVVPPPAVDLTQKGVREYEAARGDRRIGAVAQIRATPWAVWVEFPRALVTAPARTFLNRMLVTGAAVILLAAALVRTVTRRLTIPLAELTSAAESIAAGDYRRRVTADRGDEIGRLGAAFNTMGDEVEEARRRLEAQVRDRTEALEALRVSDQALTESERAYRSIFDEAPIGIAHTALDGRWLRVNQRLSQLLGFSPEELTALDSRSLTDADDIDADAAVRSRLMAGTLDRHLAARRYRRKDSREISVNLMMSLYRDANGEPRYFIAIIEDTSERLSLEDQLRQAQKMEAVGRLAGGIAHDFNNLLTAILGYANFVLEDLDAAHPSRRDVEEIRKAGESASSLTRQLLAFSRRQVLQPQIVDLNAVVRKMDGLLRRLIGEDIALSSRLTPVDSVHVDPGQVEQIILNLAVNARDAMSRGGLLTIETTNVELDSTYASTHPGASEGPHIMLAVSDNGTGMTAETVAHAFEPFYTTKPRGEGTGLGLATVYGIVKQSGGSIWVYSEPGKGSTFKVYFPRAVEAERRPPPAPPRPHPLGGGETILVAEDQPEVRALATKSLKRHGYTVLEAASGAEALRIVRDYPDPIHLLLTDVIMPVMSGRQLVDELHQTHPAIRILYASGYTDDAIVRHGMLDPGLAFLQKPFTPDSLLTKIREVLDES